MKRELPVRHMGTAPKKPAPIQPVQINTPAIPFDQMAALYGLANAQNLSLLAIAREQAKQIAALQQRVIDLEQANMDLSVPLKDDTNETAEPATNGAAHD